MNRIKRMKCIVKRVKELGWMSLMLLCLCAKGQSSDSLNSKVLPIPVELSIGNNRFGVQSIMNEPFSMKSRFSFLMVTSFMSDYKNNMENLDFVAFTQVSYDLYKGLGVAAGLNVNTVTGLSPVAGLQYIFANREILFVLTPTYEFNTDQNVQGVGVIEFKPHLSSKVTLYTRVQSLYNYSTAYEQHNRSFNQFRLGLGIRSYQFGVGYTTDYYGPGKELKDNWGIFLRSNFLQQD